MNQRSSALEGANPAVYDHVWFWLKKPWPWRTVDRKGQRCRVVAKGKMNSIAVEFEDGYRVVASRYAVRKHKSEG